MLMSTGCLALLAPVVIPGSQDSSFIFNISTVVISDKVRESTNKDLLLLGHSMTSSNVCLKDKKHTWVFPLQIYSWHEVQQLFSWAGMHLLLDHVKVIIGFQERYKLLLCFI